jgi:hypothetical protein
MTDTGKGAILFGSILVVFLALSTWSCANSRAAAKDRAEAARLAAVNQGLEIAVSQGKVDGQKLALDNAAKDKRIEELLAKRPPAPPKPGPAPVTDPELASGLLVKGLSAGVAVQVGVSSVLIPEDARKVWSWSEDAARVPQFELKSAADDVLIQEQGKLVLGLKAETAKCYEVVVLRETQLGVVGQEVTALKKENSHLLKVQVAEKWKTKIKIGGAVALGAGLGYLVWK